MNSTTPPPSPQFSALMLEISIIPAIVGVPVNAFAVLFALFNVWILFCTKILHPNLRLILFIQSALIALCACCDGFLAFNRVSTGSPFAFGSPELLAIDSFASQYVCLIGHVLLVERVMATIWVARYEKFTAPYFSLLWITLLTIVCGTNSLIFYLSMIATPGGVPTINVYTQIINYVALVLSFLEILVIAKLSLYNAAKFTQSTFYQKNVKLNSLSERYQLSENVRTMKQLSPTFVAHFAAMLGANVGLNAWYFPSIALPLVVFSTLFISLSYLAIVIYIIGFHPELRRRIRVCYRRVQRLSCGCLRRGNENRQDNNQLSLQNIRNSSENVVFPLANEHTHHFQMLQDAWT